MNELFLRGETNRVLRQTFGTFKWLHALSYFLRNFLLEVDINSGCVIVISSALPAKTELYLSIIFKYVNKDSLLASYIKLRSGIWHNCNAFIRP